MLDDHHVASGDDAAREVPPQQSRVPKRRREVRAEAARRRIRFVPEATNLPDPVSQSNSPDRETYTPPRPLLSGSDRPGIEAPTAEEDDPLMHAKVVYYVRHPLKGSERATGIVEGFDHCNTFGRLYRVRYMDNVVQYYPEAEVRGMLCGGGSSVDSDGEVSSVHSPSLDIEARPEMETSIPTPVVEDGYERASLASATPSLPPSAELPVTGWEVRGAWRKWIAWQPGVAFRGEEGEEIEYSHGDHRYTARFTSTTTGVQVNVDTRTKRPIRHNAGADQGA